MSTTVPPLSQEQILSFCEQHKTKVTPIKYSDLPDSTTECAKWILCNPKVLLWLKTADGPVGHWNALKREGMDIAWFSSYGMLPDGEKVSTPFSGTVEGQHINKVARALHMLHNLGFRIHYFAIPLQTVGDGTTSCGLWCAIFLTSRDKDFERFESRLASLAAPEAYARAVYTKSFGSN